MGLGVVGLRPTLESSSAVIDNWRNAAPNDRDTIMNIGRKPMNPLDTVTGTLISGVVLTVILVFVAKAIVGG